MRIAARLPGTASLQGWATTILLPLIIIAGLIAWLMLPEPSDAEDQASPASSAIILTAQNATNDEAAPSQAVVTAPAEATGTVGMAPSSVAPDARPEKSPLDGLQIASQSFRRGGLGSKALVTLTLRNSNDFAVKDIEIACKFVRQDGSPLTARTKLISDTINMKSRKTYSGMLIGFVNINANKARCSLVTASRT